MLFKQSVFYLHPVSTAVPRTVPLSLFQAKCNFSESYLFLEPCMRGGA